MLFLLPFVIIPGEVWPTFSELWPKEPTVPVTFVHTLKFRTCRKLNRSGFIFQRSLYNHDPKTLCGSLLGNCQIDVISLFLYSGHSPNKTSDRSRMRWLDNLCSSIHHNPIISTVVFRSLFIQGMKYHAEVLWYLPITRWGHIM